MINDIGCPRCHRLAYVCNCDVKITKVEIEARYNAALQDKMNRNHETKANPFVVREKVVC